jgi:2-keto-3-deoxy-L-rhamnonate aldolase RhmA
VNALERIRTVADKYGVAPGIHTANHEMCSRRLAQGFRFMAIASDLRFMVAGAQADLSRTVIPGREDRAQGEVVRY